MKWIRYGEGDTYSDDEGYYHDPTDRFRQYQYNEDEEDDDDDDDDEEEYDSIFYAYLFNVLYLFILYCL